MFGLRDVQELPPLASFQIKDETRQLAEAKIRAQSAAPIDTLIGGKESSAEDREESSDTNSAEHNSTADSSSDSNDATAAPSPANSSDNTGDNDPDEGD